MVSRRREVSVLVAVILIALAARVLVAVFTRSWVFSDAEHYWMYGYEMGAIGASLASGDGFAWPEWGKFPGRPTAWMAPAYPWVIAQAFRAFGVYSVPAAVFLLALQTAVSVLSCILVYVLGKHIFNRWVGLLAALMLALYPASIHYAVQKIWSTPLYGLCLLVFVLLLVRTVDRPSLRSGAMIGAVAGLTALVDALVLGFLPFAFGWLFVASKAGRKKTVGSIVTAVVVASAIMTPWIVRNSIVFGQFTFIKSNSGSALFVGNNPLATGGVKDALVTYDNMDQLLSREQLEKLQALNESEYHRFLRAEAAEWIRDNPVAFVKLSVVRTVRFWTVLKPPRGVEEQIALASYIVVLLLAIAGILMSGLRRHSVLIVLLLVSLSLPYYFTLATNIRYRFPLVPFLMLFAAHALVMMRPYAASLLTKLSPPRRS